MFQSKEFAVVSVFWKLGPMNPMSPIGTLTGCASEHPGATDMYARGDLN